MIITRTPYRVSFFGGGTDFPDYYREYGGAVISSSINRYSYIQCRILPPFFDHRYRIRYFQTERVGSIDEIKHPSVRECLRYLDFPHNLEMLHSGDIPAMSGVASSSAFTVGFLLSLHGLLGKMATKRELAEQAIEVEQKWIREHVGSQDQYATAFGGLNRIDFLTNGHIQLSPLLMSAERQRQLQDRLLFCFSGISRVSSDIQAEHIARLGDLTTELKEMRALVDVAQGFLGGSEEDLDAFGRLLDTAWKIKRRFSAEITNSNLDGMYDAAMRAGALGGKVCGAGGGGFMVFYVPPERRAAVEEALKPALIVPILLENLGAHVVFFAHEAI